MEAIVRGTDNLNSTRRISWPGGEEMLTLCSLHKKGFGENIEDCNFYLILTLSNSVVRKHHSVTDMFSEIVPRIDTTFWLECLELQ